MRTPVLVAAGGAPWEAAVVAAFEAPGSTLSVARRCVDVVELVAVAASGQARAALVEASLRRLDADAVDRMHAADIVIVAVVAPGDRDAEDRMRALGISDFVAANADSAVIASVLLEAVRARAEPPADVGAALSPASRSFGDPAMSMVVAPGDATAAVEHLAAQGSVIAVWGPTGAPGRTTVAITLADELARLGRSSLLIDADVYGGTIAAELGLLDETPGLAAACRQAAATRLDAAALAALCWQLRPGLRVLTGVPIAARWPELRPAGVSAVLGAARALADVTVVDCGFCLETDEELSFDSLAPRRNGATLAVLDAADRVVVVGAADPVGMQRIVRGLGELRDAEIQAPLTVALNKVRRGVVPGDPASELAAALELFAGRAPDVLLPYDRDALDSALASGRSLGEARPASPLRRAIAGLAAALVGEPVSRAGRPSGAATDPHAASNWRSWLGALRR